MTYEKYRGRNFSGLTRDGKHAAWCFSQRKDEDVLFVQSL